MYVTQKEISSIYQNLNGPGKKLAVYTGANHESFLNNDPIRWQKNVGSFLGSLPR